jgi:acetyl esterase/lipase
MNRSLKWLLGISLAGLMATSTTAAPAEIALWPEGMPDPVVPASPAEIAEKRPDGIALRTNISKPRLVVYPALDKTKATGAAIIVVPGGGFGRLADGHEGSEACEWLAKCGVTSFLLLHRTPTDKHPEPSTGPVQDLQKAIIEVRKRAKDLAVDPAKIGVLGFSAGGQVTVIAATNEPKFPKAATDSAKPDFLLLLYPYKIYDPAAKALRADIHPDFGLPPTFIAQSTDDGASLPQGSTLLYLELINRKVPAELHMYATGGHGFGMRPRAGATGPTDWPSRALDWLKLRGLAVAP